MADGRHALALAHAGRAEESLEMLATILRRDPLHRPIYYSYLANSYYLAGRYPASLEASRTAVDRLPAVYQARVWHAAAAAQLGFQEEAMKAAAAALRLRPNFTISRFLASIALARPDDVVRLQEGLRKAGFPE
jgi:tetratricopeptide (TPR) repeat protein